MKARNEIKLLNCFVGPEVLLLRLWWVVDIDIDKPGFEVVVDVEAAVDVDGSDASKGDVGSALGMRCSG
jgi:hypothetical protein